MARLVRKQVYLTAEQNDRLKREAKRRRTSVAVVLRGIVDEALTPAPRSWESDPLLEIVGLGSSGRRDLSESVADELYGKQHR